MRAAHWNKLLVARAIENQVYVAAVNRVGTDGKGYPYDGDSCVIDPVGDYLFHNKGEEVINTLSLSYSNLMDVREKLPFLKDRYQFEIQE